MTASTTTTRVTDEHAECVVSHCPVLRGRRVTHLIASVVTATDVATRGDLMDELCELLGGWDSIAVMAVTLHRDGVPARMALARAIDWEQTHQG